MDETRYTLAQAALISGLDPETLNDIRRIRLIDWRRQGYTLGEIRTILAGYPLKPRDQINPRAYKALELWARLNAAEEADRAAALRRICQTAERNKEEDGKRQELDGS